jgi:hypothetical protein
MRGTQYAWRVKRSIGSGGTMVNAPYEASMQAATRELRANLVPSRSHAPFF